MTKIMDMKNTIKYIVALCALAAGLLSLGSCQQEVINSDVTDLQFIFDNRGGDIFGGEGVKFHVHSQHEKFRFNEFDFPIAPNMVNIGEEYSVASDGNKEFSLESVDVPAELVGRGYIKGELEDIATGKKVKFQQLYTAYPKAAVRLEIVNPSITDDSGFTTIENEQVNNKPVLVNGDDLFIRLRCDEAIKGPVYVNSYASSLDLSDCENNIVLNKGYTPDKDGYINFWFKNVPVDIDRIDENERAYFRMNITDNTTGRTFTEEQLFDNCITLIDFRATAEVIPYSFSKGQDVKLKITCNRPTFIIAEMEGDLPFNVSKNSQLEIGEEGFYNYPMDEIFTTNNDIEPGEYTYKLILNDDSYTRRSVIVEVPYKIDDLPLTSSFKVSITKRESVYNNDKENSDTDIEDYNLHIKEGEVITFKILNTDQYSQAKFIVIPSSISDNATVTVSKVNGNNEFTVTGKKGGGKVCIKVAVEGKENVTYQNIYAWVRQVASLEIRGAFINAIKSIEPCDHFKSKHKLGYYGVPQNISARFISHNQVKDYSSGDDLEEILPVTIKSDVKLMMKLDVSANIKSPYRLDAWRNFDKTSNSYSFDEQKIDVTQLLRLKDNATPIKCDNSSYWWSLVLGPYSILLSQGNCGYHYNNGSHKSDFPGKTEKVFSWVNLKGREETSLTEVTEIMWWMNNHCAYLPKGNSVSIENKPVEDKINLYVYKLDYDKDRLFIPYIQYNYMPDSSLSEPWWWENQESKYKGLQVNNL